MKFMHYFHFDAECFATTNADHATEIDSTVTGRESTSENRIK